MKLMKTKNYSHIFCTIIFMIISLFYSLCHAETIADDHINHIDQSIFSSLLADQRQMSAELENLRKIIMNQKETIQSLEIELKSKEPIADGFNFSLWIINIVLGSVTAMIAALGVGIGIISFIGYRNIKEETKNIAEENAKLAANKLIPDVAEEIIQKHIDAGGFNKLIVQAVDKVALSNMEDSELPELGDEQ